MKLKFFKLNQIKEFSIKINLKWNFVKGKDEFRKIKISSRIEICVTRQK